MELEIVRWLSENLPPHPLLRIGIGDDAAVLRWPTEGDLVVTTDAVTDEVDFVLAETDPRLVGHKALGVNLSDLAAMAAEPLAAVVSLVLPRKGCGGRDGKQLAIELYRGMLPLAEQFNVAIAGGDTNSWDGPLAISITALGRATVHGPLTRSGARPGDYVLVTGALGGSILGRHLRVEPRVREALLLNERYELSAGMDISDGLALDASRLAAASGCGVALRLDQIPISADALRLAACDRATPLEHALGDGEDFELLLTASPKVAEQIVREQPIGVPVTIIGECVTQAGLWQIGAECRLKPLDASGYRH
ncbi:MAG: thiamine-phosphate kinase [Planctomycetaceae bacterium]|nr:thiamine-phosphate kinase [Planctomycetaceae bacterium]